MVNGVRQGSLFTNRKSPITIVVLQLTPDMKVSVNWLKDFVDVPSDPREIKRVLTGVGLGVESVTSQGDDWVLDVEVTTNRPDCLSHYGISRELAAAYRIPLKKIEVTLKEISSPATDEISIEIRNPELCARYCGRVIRNVEVKPSPAWLINRLAAVGSRSINNVADVTNYVLMELGHPLHAFALDRLRQHKILVRRARAGELLKTLDGIERKLSTENLVIADGERPVALAGVMGGEDSEITGDTKSVLLESAWFDPFSIRRTAKAHAMHTEASHRFERGADIEMAPLALDRAAALIKELAGGEILRGLIDVYPQPKRREKLNLRRSEIRRVLGADIPWEDVERTLRLLGFAVERRGIEAWGVTPPSFRLDVAREVDLIEEVARHFGYDRLPSRIVPAPPRAERDLLREKELALSQTLVSLGYHEIITSSMVDPEEGKLFSDATPVTIENPLSQEASGLRTSTLPRMLNALRWNLYRGSEDIRFFEMGKVYLRNSNGGPEERRVLALGLMGHRRPATVHNTAEKLDIFDLKGTVEELLALFDIPGLRFEEHKEVQPSQHSAVRVKSALPARIQSRASYFTSTDKLLSMYESGLLTIVLGDPKPAEKVMLAEIDLERLLEYPLRSKSFHPISKFPTVERDFSLLVPAEVTYQQIAQELQEINLPEFAGFSPVDLFHGVSAGAGGFSLLLRVTFQSEDHTLSGEEIATLSQKVVNALVPLGIHLRS
ncbi:MAG TPA: phenylalanine--tRNA ligase subunit beta [Terriglobia bacterium]|nr:phenylalanine--tRNA ligase subunit beta [Terriglobia bacterium]